MKLREIVDQLYVGVAGDRVNLISKIGIAGSLYGMGVTESGLWILPFTISTIFFNYTLFGLSTLHYYRRSTKHIQDHEKLDLRFAKTLIKGTENRKFTGYCQLQGLYLAAKKYDQLDIFKEAKSSVSNNVLPNF
jgi:hypothetical protein